LNVQDDNFYNHVLLFEHASLPREAPRLCRGGSKSLTCREVVDRRSTRSRAAKAHERGSSSMDQML
jgi:hypothetical protein